MADVLIIRKRNTFDPDGTGAPLTLQFPNSNDITHGDDLWIINYNQASTGTFTLQANPSSSLDEIEDPTDPAAAYVTSLTGLDLPGVRMNYMLDDANFSVPTWILLSIHP